MHLADLMLDIFDSLVVKKDGFGQLQLQQASGNFIPVRDVLKFQEHLRIIKMLTGKVDGNREKPHAVARPPMYGPTDLLKHIKIETAYFPILFKQGNEVGRIDHSPPGMVPSNQSLHPAQASVFHPHLGLQVNLKIAVFQRTFKQRIEIAFLLQPLGKSGIVKHALAILVSRSIAAGGLGPVLDHRDLQCRIVHNVSPWLKDEIIGGAQRPVKRIDGFAQRLEPGSDGFRIFLFQAKEKQVGVRTGCRFLRPHSLVQAIHDIREGPVPLLAAEILID